MIAQKFHILRRYKRRRKEKKKRIAINHLMHNTSYVRIRLFFKRLKGVCMAWCDLVCLFVTCSDQKLIMCCVGNAFLIHCCDDASSSHNQNKKNSEVVLFCHSNEMNEEWAVKKLCLHFSSFSDSTNTLSLFACCLELQIIQLKYF